VASAISRFMRRHKDALWAIVFNLARPFGHLRLPTYNLTFRYAMNAARAGYWRAKIGKMGKGVLIDSGVIIRGNPKNVEIGDYSYLDTRVQLQVYEPIKIGRYVHITSDVFIQSAAEVIIGDFVGISAGTRIYAGSNKYKAADGREKDVLLSMSAVAPPQLQYSEGNPVIIEDYAFIGLNSTVLPGVSIGRGAVAGAGSVVTRNIPPYSIAVGAPARVVAQRPIPESEKEPAIKR
jgi:acetyltransferase-like isoleucine patch superfamily enzyme